MMMLKNANQKKSKSRAYMLAAIAVLVLGGVASYAFTSLKSTDDQQEQTAIQTEKTNNAYASIPSDDIKRSESNVDFMWKPESYPIVAHVQTDSIDGGRTYSPVFEQYVAPHTYGKMTVREAYKGNVKPGEQLSYSRLGGIVTYEEYWNSLNKQQQDKILHLNSGEQPDHKAYVQSKAADDIDIEVGENYVVFLTPQSSEDGKIHEYVIGGYQLGLRQAKGSGPDVTVLNNNTKEWGSLSSIIKLD